MSLGNRSQMLLAACYGRRPSGRPTKDAAAGVANSTAAARPFVFPLDDDFTLRYVS